MAIEGSYMLYGLKNINLIIDEIIKNINAYDYSFDIKLILSEALSNAFSHGNNNDAAKPIYLNYYYEDNNIEFKIKSTEKILNYSITEDICDENLLNSHGRGLFLIKCFADKIELKDDALVIVKNLGRQ